MEKKSTISYETPSVKIHEIKVRKVLCNSGGAPSQTESFNREEEVDWF